MMAEDSATAFEQQTGGETATMRLFLHVSRSFLILPVVISLLVFPGICRAAESIPLDIQALEHAGIEDAAHLKDIISKAEAGDAEAQFRLGDYSQFVTVYMGDTHPRTPPVNNIKAAFWFEKAADQGFAPAQVRLGNLYSMGDDVPKDEKKGAALMRKAALHGDSDGQNILASYYEHGTGVDPEYAEAHYWWDKAVAQGNKNAESNLYPVHIPLAMEEVIHQEIGDDGWNALVINDYNLAYDFCLIPARNKDVPLDNRYTLRLLAAAAGSPAAQMAEAKAVETKMPVTAYVWYNFAARSGLSAGTTAATALEHKMTKEQLSDAKMIVADWRPKPPKVYLSDRPSYNEALPSPPPKVTTAGQPARQASMTETDLVALRIGETQRSADVAAYVQSIRSLAVKGDARAQNFLAEQYERGYWVKADPAESIKWWRRAAEQGDADAEYSLGVRYELGKDVPLDLNEAISWLSKSARHGHGSAAGQLSKIYETGGKGLDVDRVKALLWHQIAKYGNDNGLTERMTPDQVAEAERELAEWKPPAPRPSPASLPPLPSPPEMHPPQVLAADECASVPSDDEFRRIAAEAGDAFAQWDIGYSFTRPGKENVDEAMKWLRKAAEQGLDQAQVIIGKVYAHQTDDIPDGFKHDVAFIQKTNMPQNFYEAAKWYRKAADQGNREAMYFLGLLYRDGRGVPQDYHEAAFWIGLTARGGGGAYEEMRNGLTSAHLTSDQTAAVYKRIVNWKPLPKPLPAKPRVNFASVLCGKGKAFCAAVDQCGDVIGVDCNSGGDGPYYFVDRGTKQVFGSCSFWQGKCIPPEQWACGRPKNYH